MKNKILTNKILSFECEILTIQVPILKKKNEPLLNIILMSVELATLVLIKNFISVFQTFQKPSIHQLGEVPFIWSVERFPFL